MNERTRSSKIIAAPVTKLPDSIPTKVKEMFRASSLGPYLMNVWTKIADNNHELFTEPFMDKGLTLDTYPYWLDWLNIFILSEKTATDHRNPIDLGIKEIDDLIGFPPFWAISFKDKGFTVGGDLVEYGSDVILPPEPVIITEFQYQRQFIIERERIQDMFGKLAIVDRIYRKENKEELTKLVIASIKEDPEAGIEYQIYSWQVENPLEKDPKKQIERFGVYSKISLQDLFDTPKPLDEVLGANANAWWSKSVY